MKGKGKRQSDNRKLQHEAKKTEAKDKMKRDQMEKGLLVDAAKVNGEYGTDVDVARVQAEQDKVRMIGGMAQGVPQQ